MKKFLLFPIVSICISGYALAGEWVSKELCVIKRGIGQNKIDYSPGGTVGGPGTFEEPGEGPHTAIVDTEENIIIGSFSTRQLKGFSNTGDLIFDLSEGSPDYSSELYSGYIFEMCVDSLSNIYLVIDPPAKTVPVINYNGELVGNLRSPDQSRYAKIRRISHAPDGRIFYFMTPGGWVCYQNGSYKQGGTPLFAASDGNFYGARKGGPGSIMFIKFVNPGQFGKPESKDSTEIFIDTDTLVTAGLLNGGDGFYLYVILAVNKYFNYEIWQFDLDYNVVDKLTLKNEEAYGDLRLLPFIRKDGNIYQFLFREDGMYVIRWSKE